MSVETQWGSGLNDGATEVAHSYAKASVEIARHKNISAALFCLDLKTAFASMLRQFTVPVPRGNDSRQVFVNRLVKNGFDRCTANDIYRDADALQNWAQAGGSDHVAEYLRNLYSNNTWFSFEGLAGAVRVESGTLAGTSLGDIIFTMSVSCIFRNIRARLNDAGIPFEFDITKVKEHLGFDVHDDFPEGAKKLHEASFVDDGIVPILAKAENILDIIASVAAIIDSEFSSHGYTLNYTKGKTEVLFFFHGPGAKLVKAKLFADLGGIIQFTNDQGINKDLLATTSYKHLGSLVVTTGSHMPEITAKSQAMIGTLKPISSKVLSNPRVSVEKRLIIAKAYLFSKGLFQASTWHNLNVGETKKVHSTIMRVYRVILRVHRPGSRHLTDDQVIEELEAMSPISLIVALKLSFFVRSIFRLPYALIAIWSNAYAFKGSWIKSVETDLNRLAAVSDKLAEMRGKCLADWVVFIRKILRPV